MFGWDFEVDAWSRFWRWNMIKICVWTCDMNSTLGSVVPLAMFLMIVIAIFSRSIFLLGSSTVPNWPSSSRGFSQSNQYKRSSSEIWVFLELRDEASSKILRWWTFYKERQNGQVQAHCRSGKPLQNIWHRRWIRCWWCFLDNFRYITF